jgi:hypothetical protein
VTRLLTIVMLATGLLISNLHEAAADEHDCLGQRCTALKVRDQAVEISAQNINSPDARGLRLASNSPADGPALFTWRLRAACTAEDAATVSCDSRTRACPTVEGRVVQLWIVQRQRLAQPGGTAVEDMNPPSGATPGTPFGPWIVDGAACVDVTELNPPPSPAEVFSYFQRLPLPELEPRHQPPGNGLSGLPVIFYTDQPTTQTFTVDVRGFEVVINAGATAFTWNTGDPAAPTITTGHPGAPYPDHTITHPYRSGSYTASLTVTWGATFTVDGGAPADVPGTTTTDGPPDTFDVLQARPVLVNPR